MLTTKIKRKRALNLIWNFHSRTTMKKTVSATFSLEDLKKYIDLCAEDKDNEKIRVYFGRYSKENIINLKDPDYDERHTVIFVPVTAKGIENIPKALVDPFNEGQLCPPLPGCDNEHTLFRDAFDPAENDPTEFDTP